MSAAAMVQEVATQLAGFCGGVFSTVAADALGPSVLERVKRALGGSFPATPDELRARLESESDLTRNLADILNIRLERTEQNASGGGQFTFNAPVEIKGDMVGGSKIVSTDT